MVRCLDSRRYAYFAPDMLHQGRAKKINNYVVILWIVGCVFNMFLNQILIEIIN